MSKKQAGELKRTPTWIVVVIIVFCVALWLVPITFFVVGMFSGWFEFKDIEIQERGNAILINDGVFTIDKSTLKGTYGILEENGYYTYTITGYIENTTANNYDSLMLSFKLYDNSGVILGVTTAYLENFKAGEKWRFKTEQYVDDIEEIYKFELSKVEYYNYWD